MMTPYPGKYDTSSTPYVREPLEVWSNQKARVLTLCWSAQSSKTTTELIALGYDVVNNPSNTMFVMPTESMVRRFEKQKVAPFIANNKVLNEHLLKGKDFNTITSKYFNNGQYLQLVWSNSATELASSTVGKIFFDEVDKYPKQVNGEADPISLGMERLKTVHNSQTFITSTVTKKSGFVWQHFLDGNQSYFFVKSPYVNKWFRFEWDKCVRWNNDLKGIEERVDTAEFFCPFSERAISEKQRMDMVKAGKWQATNKFAAEGYFSYHINEMYSPFTSIKSLVRKFLMAKKKLKSEGVVEPLKNFVNSSLALPWEEEITKTHNQDSIWLTRDKRDRGVVPKETVGLVMGVDTQDDGFYYVVRAFGRYGTNWLIEEDFAHDLDVVDNIFMNKVWLTASGKEYQINNGFIDSGGHRTSEVYDYCRMNRYMIPIKGSRHSMSRQYRKFAVDTLQGSNEAVYGGLFRVDLDVGYYKNMLSRSIYKVREEDEYNVANAFYSHKNINKSYVAQMSSEHINDKAQWVCPKGRANHFWDCEVYALACAEFFQICYRLAQEDIEEAEDSGADDEEDVGVLGF